MTLRRQSRDIALSRPAGWSARAPQVVLQVGKFLFGLIGIPACVVELLLSIGDFRAEPVFPIVNIALTQKLCVLIFELQIQKLSFLFRFLYLITQLLKLRSPACRILPSEPGRWESLRPR